MAWFVAATATVARDAALCRLVRLLRRYGRYGGELFYRLLGLERAASFVCLGCCFNFDVEIVVVVISCAVDVGVGVGTRS